MTPQQIAFIGKVAPGAQVAQKEHGVFASVSIAQSIYESSWGRSELTVEANNLFGVKVSAGWHGDFISMKTGEDTKDGKSYTITAEFRKYANWADSINDHALFLTNNGKPDRYRAALQCKNGIDQARAIGAAGYSTNPKYGDMLVAAINDYDLTRYDK
jgi:flagellum-specific peptidoglycan hydrolase FlgJ